MHYTRLRVTCGESLRDLLTAQLSELGFDAFLETDDGFEAYTGEGPYDHQATIKLLQGYSAEQPVRFTFDTIEKRNWNEEWERSYQPIDVEGKCLIRADFHPPDPRYPYDIIITPRMSFGTGHHQTTWLMIKSQMEIDHRGKRVMDAGCGTAILSIMAEKLGAREVEAFDIDEWSIVNGMDNVAVNQCENIRIQQGSIAELSLQGMFDIILANINKNVLLSEMKLYAGVLNAGATLLLSGFYTGDIDDLLETAYPLGLKELFRDEKETWAVLALRKHD